MQVQWQVWQLGRGWPCQNVDAGDAIALGPKAGRSMRTRYSSNAFCQRRRAGSNLEVVPDRQGERCQPSSTYFTT